MLVERGLLLLPDVHQDQPAPRTHCLPRQTGKQTTRSWFSSFMMQFMIPFFTKTKWIQGYIMCISRRRKIVYNQEIWLFKAFYPVMIFFFSSFPLFALLYFLCQGQDPNPQLLSSNFPDLKIYSYQAKPNEDQHFGRIRISFLFRLGSGSSLYFYSGLTMCRSTRRPSATRRSSSSSLPGRLCSLYEMQ